jgi:chorismate dehydratase
VRGGALFVKYPVKLGAVKYLNTLPLIEGLELAREVSITSAAPAKLGPMLTRGEVDIALASIVDYMRGGDDASPKRLVLLPVGGIGCDGPTLTVRLFSKVPLEQVRVIHADTDSHTSVLLARLLLEDFVHARGVEGKMGQDGRIGIVDYDARERVSIGANAGGSAVEHESQWPQTLLLIGDKVVVDSPPAVRYPYQMDLGEAWKAWTGLPFVYAMWMCAADDVARPEFIVAAQLLHRQRLRNTHRIEWLIDKAVDERRWPRDLAQAYVTEYLRYEIGSRQKAGVERFLRAIARKGWVRGEEIRWGDEG